MRGRMMDVITLFDPLIFMTTHLSFVVNKDHVIDERKRGDGLTALLTNDEEALVSELYKDIFLTWLNEKKMKMKKS